MGKTIFGNTGAVHIGAVGNIVNGNYNQIGNTTINSDPGMKDSRSTSEQETILREVQKVRSDLAETEQAMNEWADAVRKKSRRL